MAENRYIRQTTLPQFGKEGQQKLKSAKVLVVGLGGLGIPVATYLNAMGVGTLGLVENDVIALHNLQRQVLYAETDVGKQKLTVAVEKLKAQNSESKLVPFATFISVTNAIEIISQFDLIVDATDNFATRYLLNDACVIAKKPLVYGALHGFEGQLTVFNYKNGPTLRCLFPSQPKQEEIPSCNENGVLGILPSIVGSLQALEVVKLVTGVGEVLSGKLLLYDGLSQSTQKIGFQVKPENLEIQKLLISYQDGGCNALNSIASEEFLALLREKQPQIIDVRTTLEFKEDHLHHSINIPLAELSNNLNKIDFLAPVYLLCQSGKRSISAYNQLSELYPEAELWNINGGLNQLNQHIFAS